MKSNVGAVSDRYQRFICRKFSVHRSLLSARSSDVKKVKRNTFTRTMLLVDCSSIPESVWIEIFTYLDAQSLLRITETCRLFANIFVNSRKLSEKIRLNVNINDDVPSQLQALQNSQRTYRNLFIGCNETAFHRNYPQLEGINLQTIRGIFGENVTSLKLKNIYMKTHSIIQLLQSFVNLRRCNIERILLCDHSHFNYNSMDERDRRILKTATFAFAKLEELTMIKCDFFCFYFFEEVYGLRSVIVDDLVFDIIDTVHFENFLMKQKRLKELRLRKFRNNYIFQTSLLASAPFQLNTLAINSVYWKDKHNGTAFFRNQHKIKTFELALKNRWNVRYDELMWYNDILKCVFTNNKELNTIFISTIERHGFDIKSCDFLDGIICPSVERLTYYQGKIDQTSALMNIFVKLFPNLKHFKHNCDTDIGTLDLSCLSSWKQLESLDLYTD